MSILTPFVRGFAFLAILSGGVCSMAEAYGKAEDPDKPAVRYDTSQFTPHYLYPGGEVVLSVDALTRPEERVMAITFDDGPDTQDLELLEVLKKYEVPATFFYLGSKVKAFPEIVKKVSAGQHEIGFHSMRHQRVKWFSQAGQSDEFRQGKEILANLGVNMSLFRPPYGDFNERLVRTAKDNGMETVLWTIDSRDWTGIGADAMAKNVIRHFHPGAVLLFHSQHPVTLRAVPKVLEAAERENYRFVSLGDWRTTVLAANCRHEGRSSCPAGPTLAARSANRPVAKSPEPSTAEEKVKEIKTVSTSKSVNAKKSAAKSVRPVVVSETEPYEEEDVSEMVPEQDASEQDIDSSGGADGDEVPVISRVIDPVVPVIVPISNVSD